MTNEELIRRLEALYLPDISLEVHRRELRAALLKEYTEIKSRRGRLAWLSFLKFRPLVWRTVIATSMAWVLIFIFIFAVIIPANQPQSAAAMAIDTVLASREVQAALANDEMEAVAVSNIGTNLLEITIESRGGTIIIATVDTTGNQPVIKEITNIIPTGSIYEERHYITGEERGEVLSVAKLDHNFKELLDKGATVERIEAVQSIVVTRNMDTGETDHTREGWAMVTLEFQDEQWFFLVSIERTKVINRGSRVIR
ncbi:MAG: hypothetical protein Q8Q07_05205 [Dehalococcoidales bacterium]|nr:hypothetical protein [Dehalococcoidales bacterium]